MKHRLARLLPLCGIFLFSLLALAGTLSAALVAHAGATRVAVFASSQAWKDVTAAGLPVVRLTLGGLLIVVDGAAAPAALARLRQGSLFLLDASLIPGCEEPATGPEGKVPS